MIKVFIVDDHEIIREGLKMIIREAPDLKFAGEAQDATEGLKRIKTTDCDVVILDLNMPDKNGLDVIADIKNAKPKAHILMLSIQPEEKFAIRSLKAGASGYLSKDAALEELVNAIRKVHTRGRYISARLAEQIAFEVVPEDSLALYDTLSSREREIMLKIAKGCKVKEIAEELELSESTVFTYRMRILEKLSMKSNVELARYAIENNLVN